jgi:hypothetical protein
VTVTTTVSGAVALLLYSARPDREIDDGLAEAILDLRELVGAETRELLDRWLGEGGPDGEHIYCLDRLLRDRFIAEPQFRAAVADVVRVGQVSRDAVGALADHCRRAGYRGAYDWCQAALGIRVVPTQALEPPVRLIR